MKVWHMSFSSQGRQPFFPSLPEQRKAIRALARIAGGTLALFSIVDEHTHLLPLGERHEVGRLAQRIFLAFSAISATRLHKPVYCEPVESRSHLLNLLDYLLGQPARHGLPGHPALWTGSAYCDLIGARLVPGLGLRLLEVLPRFTTQQAHEAVGLASAHPVTLPLEQVRMLGAFRLAAAAGATLAAEPSMKGNETSSVMARSAVVHLARAAQIPSSEVGAALSLCPRSVRRLELAPVQQHIQQSIRLRLGLEERVGMKLPSRLAG